MKPIPIIRLALASAALLAGVVNCGDSNANPALTELPEPLAVNNANPNPNLPDAAELGFKRGAADSVRAHYASTDSSDVGVTPWFPAGSGTLPLIGLRAGTTYNVTLEARRAETSVLGPSASYNSPPLPQALRGASMTLVSGTPPVSGYTLTAMSGPDGHGYLHPRRRRNRIRWRYE